MEGPTPVSSLLHSCTLVMAGIFVYLRFLPSIYIYYCLAMLFMFILLGSYVYETDLKRIIAFSTVLMLSTMWAFLDWRCFHNFINIAVLHAGYKSALFITIGKFIVNTNSANTHTRFYTGVSGIFILMIILASAPTGSIYANTKHSCLFNYFTSYSTTSLSVFALLIPISTWILQFRVL